MGQTELRFFGIRQLRVSYRRKTVRKGDTGILRGRFLTHCRYSAWNTAAEGALVPEYLEQVVNQGDEIPLIAHIGKASQGEGSKAAHRFDLTEYRFY